jgi:cytochrome oxidase assembly protein ShyY1
MAGSDTADDTDDSLTRQLLNMVLENNALTPYFIMWIVFNVALLALLIYVSVRVSLK